MAEFNTLPATEAPPAHQPLFDSLSLPCWTATAEGRTLSCNLAWCEYTGLSPDSPGAESWLGAAVHADDVESVRTAWTLCVDTGEPSRVEARLAHTPGQTWRWNDLRIQPVRGSQDGEFIGVAVDIHERRIDEQNARLLNQAAELLGSTLDPDRIYAHLRDLVSSSMVCDSLTISLYDPDEKLIRCSYAWLEGEAVNAASLPAIPLAPDGKGMQSAVIRSGQAMLVNDFQAAVANSVTVYHVDKGGKIDTDQSSSALRTQAAILVPIKLDGNVLGVTRVLSNYRKDVYTQDQVRVLETLMSQVAAATRNATLYQRSREEIEERIKAERQLRETQQEVDSLNMRLLRAMQETHHRVKNNLQVICALVELQVETGRDTVSMGEFRRIGDHVRALAALHDLLTEAARDKDDVDTLSVRDAFEKLAPVLQQAAAGRLRSMDVQDLRLPVQQAAALTILVNELVANAARHGRGAIRLRCRMNGDRARLEVQDEGPGFPAGFDPRTAGMGLELVETLGRWDLRGETCYENPGEGGARAVLVFPIAESLPIAS